MADNNVALDNIKYLIADLQLCEISFADFVDKFERICFNEVSSNSLNNFSDGWQKGTVSSFMKVCLRAFVDGDEKAVSRLLVDLGVNREL